MKAIKWVSALIICASLFQCTEESGKSVFTSPKIQEKVEKVVIDSLNNKITFFGRNFRSGAFNYCPKGTVGQGCTVANVLFEGNEDCGIIAGGIKLQGTLGCESETSGMCAINISDNVSLLLIDSQGNVVASGCPGCDLRLGSLPNGDYIVVASRTNSGHVEIKISVSPTGCTSCSDFPGFCSDY